MEWTLTHAHTSHLPSLCSTLAVGIVILLCVIISKYNRIAKETCAIWMRDLNTIADSQSLQMALVTTVPIVVKH